MWYGQALGQDQTAQGREGIIRLPGTTGFQSDSGHERSCGTVRRLVGRFDIHHLSLQGVHGLYNEYARIPSSQVTHLLIGKPTN